MFADILRPSTARRSERGTEESNLELRFWRPQCLPLHQSPWNDPIVTRVFALTTRLRTVRLVRCNCEHVFVPGRRTLSDYRKVIALLEEELGYEAVARETGVPAPTVRNWWLKGRPGRGLWEESYAGWRPPDPEAYCYLLGLYLGDGCILHFPRGATRLDLSLDARYPAIVESAAEAIRATAPDAHISSCRKPGAILLYGTHPVWPDAIPQDGPGRKHRRTIALVEWQQELTHRHPHALLRGLIHSDGSRVLNRFKTTRPSGRVAHYSYVRYFFTNYSADIRQIFCEHCELLGIRWTQSSFKNISVSHRDSVAILDSFIGPKR
jgi:hypothetical protein